MRTERLRGALEHLCLTDGGGLTDGQLLARFIDGREEAAFAALVRRHGPMVFGVCRRLLGNVHDAEDAFQAAFLVLARKAASVARREAVGGFLYGVAYRTALRAKARAARRRAVETQVEQLPHPEVPPAEVQDWRPVLDRELSRLPEKYRDPVLLCDLEGKTRREAARQLGLPEGTLASRLATARRMLARRLVRCGVALSGGALAVALAQGAASAAVPARLAVMTGKAAALVAAGQAAAVATPAAALMNEVLTAMLMKKVKIFLAAALAAVLIGAGGLAYRAAGQAPQTESRPLSELELLRREVDILKLQMEVVQEKQRAQEAELRALKGRPGGGAAGRSPGSIGRPMGPAGPNNVPAPPALDALPAAPADPAAPKAPELRPGSPAPASAERPASAAPALDAPPGPAPKAPRSAEVPAPEPEGPKADRAAPALPPPAAEDRPVPISPATRADTEVPSPSGATLPAGPEQQMEAAMKAYREARDDAARRRALDLLEKAVKDLRRPQKPATSVPASS